MNKILTKQQHSAISFLCKNKGALLLADVGTGKTVITLTALHKLFAEGKINGVLLCAPKRVVETVWQQECAEWEHLKTHKFKFGVLTGVTHKSRGALLKNKEINFYLINYELISWLTENYPDGIDGVDVLVFDEVDKMKDVRSVRYKGKPRRNNAPRVYGMKDYRKHFTRHYGLTGTPVPKHLLDIYAQAFLIDGGKAFGTSFYQFRDKNFYTPPYRTYTFMPLPGTDIWIENALKPFTFRIEQTQNAIAIPAIRDLPPRFVYHKPDTRKDYRKLERDYIVKIENDTITADTAATLYGKLRQIAQGFSYIGLDTAKRTVQWHDTGKLAELQSLISELQGQQLLIVYHFQAQEKAILQLGNEVEIGKSYSSYDRWNSGELPIMGLHPQTAGHGLNLQKSGAHHIVFLTLPESVGAYKQTIGRLVRTGNPAQTVYVHKILTKDTVDEQALARIENEHITQEQLLAAMKRRYA